jgi:hypothetical protein
LDTGTSIEEKLNVLRAGIVANGTRISDGNESLQTQTSALARIEIQIAVMAEDLAMRLDRLRG